MAMSDWWNQYVSESVYTIRTDTASEIRINPDRSYFQTAPLQDSREFYYSYEPIDISALEPILGRLRYNENGDLIFEDPQQEPDICLPKEVVEEVL